MTLEEFKKKYGTDTVGLIIDELLFRMATKRPMSTLELRQIEELKSDINKLLEGTK